MESGGHGDAGSEDTSTFISINGDENLIYQAGIYSWSGSGTSSDPYVISDLDLIGNDTNSAIYIGGTTLALELKNIIIDDQRVEQTYSVIEIVQSSGLVLSNIDILNPMDHSLTIAETANTSIINSTFGESYIDSCNNLSFTNNSWASCGGITMLDCDDMVLNGNSVTNVSSIYLGRSDGITIKENTFTTIGMGIRVLDSVNLTFWSNTFNNCSILIQDYSSDSICDDSYATLVATQNNTVNGLPLIFLKDLDLGGSDLMMTAGQLILFNVTNATISGYDIGMTTNALAIVNCADLSVHDNNLSWSYSALWISNSRNISFDHNVIWHCYEGIQVLRSNELVISDNVLDGNYYGYGCNDLEEAGEYGIISYDCQSDILRNHLINYYYGIQVREGSIGNVSWNHIDRSYFGLSAITVTSNRFRGNEISGSWDGIFIRESSNIDVDNNLLFQNQNGCLLYYSDTCEIQGNNISDNVDYGINLYTGSDNNLIFNNSVSYNNDAGDVYSSGTVQASDRGSGNLWNTSVGGNHWSDWTSPDVDSNNIVDSPYPIDGTAGAKDHLPLVSLSVIDDEVPPELTINSPTNDTWLGTSEVIVSWTAFDNDTRVVRYYLNIDGEGWEDNGMATSYGIIVSDGPHTFSVKALDLAGNQAVRNVSVNIDTTAPMLSIEPVGEYVYSSSLQLNWTATDAGIGIEKVEMSIDQGEWTDVTGLSTYLLTDLSDHRYNITFRAFDSLGHNTTVSFEVNVDLVVNYLEITAPNEGYTNARDIVVTWRAYDWTTYVTKVEMNIDNGSWFEVSGESYTITGLGEGNHSISIRAWDTADHNATRTVRIIIDRTAPNVEYVTPADGAIYDTSDVPVTWVAFDESGYHISWELDGDGTFHGATSNFTLTGLTDGQHTFMFICGDNAGNFIPDHLVTFIVDTRAPDVSITSPTSGRMINSNAVSVSWTITDVTEVTARWRLDGGDWHSASSNSIGLTGLSEGGHTFDISCRDEIGRYGNRSVTFTIDTVSPSISISGPATGLYGTRDITISWAGSDTNGISSFRLLVDGESTDHPSDTSECTIHDLADGVYTITVMAFDHAGNHDEDSITITIDATAPSVTITSPGTGAFVNSSDLVVSWSAQDGSGIASYNVSIDGVWTALSNTTEDRSFDDLSEGIHNVTIEAKDVLGNIALVSVEFIVDTIDPTVSIISPATSSFNNTGAVTVIWAGTDVNGIANYYVSIDGQTAVIMTALNKTFFALSDGVHSITVEAVDAAGNSASSAISFTVDKIAPTAGCAVEGDVRSSSWNLTITLSEVVRTDGLSLVVNEATVDMTVIDQLIMKAFIDAPLSGDLIIVNLTCTDVAGNIATLTWTFEIDPLEHFVNGTVLDDDGEPIGDASVYCNGTLVATTDANGNFSFTIVPGGYELRIVKDGYLNLTRSLHLTDEDQGMSGLVLSSEAVTDDDEGGMDMSVVLMAIGAIAIVAVGAMLFMRVRKK